jgi:hypothetical protein
MAIAKHASAMQYAPMSEYNAPDSSFVTVPVCFRECRGSRGVFRYDKNAFTCSETGEQKRSIELIQKTDRGYRDNIARGCCFLAYLISDTCLHTNYSMANSFGSGR